MPRPDLESLSPALFSTCATTLGDTIEYAADGSTFVSFKADRVDYRQAIKAFESAQAIEQAIEIEVLKTDVPTMPSSSVRIRLPKLPGLVFRPVNPLDSESALTWLFEVKQVASG